MNWKQRKQRYGDDYLDTSIRKLMTKINTHWLKWYYTVSPEEFAVYIAECRIVNPGFIDYMQKLLHIEI